MQLCKRLRRHVEGTVDAIIVVVVDGAVDLGDEFSERIEAIRIAELNLELVVEALLVSVLPRTPFLRARDLNVAIREYLPECDRVVLDAVVAVEDGGTRIVEKRRPQWITSVAPCVVRIDTPRMARVYTSMTVAR